MSSKKTEKDPIYRWKFPQAWPDAILLIIAIFCQNYYQKIVYLGYFQILFLAALWILIARRLRSFFHQNLNIASNQTPSIDPHLIHWNLESVINIVLPIYFATFLKHMMGIKLGKDYLLISSMIIIG